MSDTERDARIRLRAYFLWLQEGRPEGRADEHWRRAAEAEDDSNAVDEASDESFPASDPPSHSVIIGVVARS
jgi:hypothetical protein